MSRRWGPVAYALFVLGLGGFIAVETARLSVGPGYAAIGPRLFPALVAGGLILVGLGMLAVAVRGALPAVAERLDLKALALITLGLAAQAGLMGRLGFVPASAILFLTVTTAFGSRRWLRDGVIALMLPLAVYLAFTRGLGLTLPAGVLEGLL